MLPSSAEAVLTIKPHGELTAGTAVQFRDQTLAAMYGRCSVEADLSRITAMDCAGLGALIAIRNQACACQGRMRLCRPSPVVQRLLTAMSAGHLFEIEQVISQPVPPLESALMVEPLPNLVSFEPPSSGLNEPCGAW